MQSAPTLPAAKRKGIQWEKTHSAHTSWLIAWCKANDDAHIKLFSDSVKDAKDQGRKKKQSGTPKETYYFQLASLIFSNDKDPEMWLLFLQNPNACFRLRKKYNEFNKALKQSGAGITYEDLQKDPETKTLIGGLFKTQKFPWWPDLHGWWRTNPAFNTTSLSADLGQNFKSAALQYFSRSGSNNTHVSNENNPDGDNELELEEGKIDEIDDMY
ncbi:hypothetical protein BDR06DRAFT_886347 [Suillus hirtellus]|nr:hypothetical protein BDR06DRAFT_886347 [Suillus hirtellus]